jgi:hypothetical protein
MFTSFVRLSGHGLSATAPARLSNPAVMGLDSTIQTERGPNEDQGPLCDLR